MTEIQKKKEMQKKNAMNAVVAGVAGVVAGGMAVAAAVVMSDTKNQKKAKAIWNGAKEQVTEKVGHFAETIKQKIDGKKE